MDALKDHPLAAIVPPMAEEEYKALVADIAANGLIEPIVLYEGQILDGRHRYRACAELGIEPKYTSYDGDQPAAFVLSQNLHRRHLTPSQRAALALAAKPHLEEEARKRQRAAAEVTHLKLGRKVNEEMLVQNFAQACEDDESGRVRQQLANQFGVNHAYIDYAGYVAQRDPDLLEQVRRGEVNLHHAYRELRQREIVQTAPPPPDLPDKRYRCLVIDPPWPMEKILREVAPNQAEMDYPTMSLEEIATLPVPDLADPTGCHVYLWVTHKYLPEGLRLFERWGIRYQCVMTWVKNVGFTPFSWMYSTEHVLFGRVGSLDLLRNGLRLDFSAPRREHSRKPDVFYDLVRQASPAPRLDMFSRESRDGFEQWGNEPEKFSQAVGGPMGAEQSLG